MRSTARNLISGLALTCLVALSSPFPGAWGARPSGSSSAAAASCSPPPGVTCLTDVQYAAGGSEHTLDVYFPTGASGEPSVILIHGGGWKSNDKTLLAHEAGYFAENGFAAFTINYTLSTPETPSWPQVFVDVETATRWVCAHARDYAADGTRLAAFGPSAGGHLSALLDAKGPEDGIRIKTAVSLSGPMDLGVVYREGGGMAAIDVEQLLGCVPGSCPGNEDVDASPISHVTSDDGSMLFFNSVTEPIPLDQAQAMDRALNAAHVPHKLDVVPGSAHARAYECHPEVIVLGQSGPAIDGVVRWLAKYLTGQQITPSGTYCAP